MPFLRNRFRLRRSHGRSEFRYRRRPSYETNPQYLALPPDDLAVVGRADIGFEDEFAGTKNDVRGLEQGARLGNVEYLAAHRAVAPAVNDEGAFERSPSRVETAFRRGALARKGLFRSRSFTV